MTVDYNKVGLDPFVPLALLVSTMSGSIMSLHMKLHHVFGLPSLKNGEPKLTSVLCKCPNLWYLDIATESRIR